MIVSLMVAYDYGNEGCVLTNTAIEDVRDIRFGLYSFQRMSALHAKTLASLCATSCKNGATTLGGHTCTETVGLGAFACIRLISALHGISLHCLSATW